MSDYYEEDGWEVLVSTPSGEKKQALYAVAVKSDAEARRIVESLLKPGSSIVAMFHTEASQMQTYTLHPGRWAKGRLYG